VRLGLEPPLSELGHRGEVPLASGLVVLELALGRRHLEVRLHQQFRLLRSREALLEVLHGLHHPRPLLGLLVDEGGVVLGAGRVLGGRVELGVAGEGARRRVVQLQILQRPGRVVERVLAVPGPGVLLHQQQVAVHRLVEVVGVLGVPGDAEERVVGEGRAGVIGLHPLVEPERTLEAPGRLETTGRVVEGLVGELVPRILGHQRHEQPSGLVELLLLHELGGPVEAAAQLELLQGGGQLRVRGHLQPLQPHRRLLHRRPVLHREIGLDDEVGGVTGHLGLGPAPHHLLEAAARLLVLVVDVEDLARLVGDGRPLGVVRDLRQEGVGLAHQAHLRRRQRLGPGHLGRRALGGAQHLAVRDLPRGAQPRHLALPGDDRREPRLGEVLVVGGVVAHVGVDLRRPGEVERVVETVGLAVGQLVGVPGVRKLGEVLAVGARGLAVLRHGQLELPLLLVALGLGVVDGGGAHQALLPEVAHLLHQVGVAPVLPPPVAALVVGGHQALARLRLPVEAAVPLPGGHDLGLDPRGLGRERALGDDQLVGLHRLRVLGLVEEDVAQALVELGLVGASAEGLEEGARPRHAAPALVGKADGGVLDGLGPDVAGGRPAALPRFLDVEVEELHEGLHRAGEVVHAVPGPAELVEGAGVERVGRVGANLGERLGRPLQGVGLHLVEVPVAEPDPGLGHEGALRVVLDEGQEDPARLLPLPHLAQAVAEQVVDAVEEAVVGEPGDEPLVERDGGGIALHRLGGGIATLGHGLLHLLPPLGELLAVLVVGPLVVQLGQAEHGVRREAGVVGVAGEELLELRDGVLPLLALENLQVLDGLLVVLGEEAAPLVVLLLDQQLDLLPVLPAQVLEALRPAGDLLEVALPHRGLGRRRAAARLGGLRRPRLAPLQAGAVPGRLGRRPGRRRRGAGPGPQRRQGGERGGEAGHPYCTSRSTPLNSSSMAERSTVLAVESCWIFSTRSRLRCQATSTMPMSALRTSW
jgi:hypothetical protein